MEGRQFLLAPMVPSPGAAHAVHALFWGLPAEGCASQWRWVMLSELQPRAGHLTSAGDACPIDGHLTHGTDRWFLPEDLLSEAMWLSFPRLMGGGTDRQTEVSVPMGPSPGLGQA